MRGVEEARRGRTGSDPHLPAAAEFCADPSSVAFGDTFSHKGRRGSQASPPPKIRQADDQRKADPSFLAEAVVIRNQQMQRRLVLFDGGKAADRIGENIIGQVVIDGRDLADQNVAALAPEGMPDAR